MIESVVTSSFNIVSDYDCLLTGIHAPPVSVSGAKLPGSRLVSIVMFPDVPKNDPLWTLSSMSWGQLMTHDLSMAMGTTQASQCFILYSTCRTNKRTLYFASCCVTFPL